MSDVAGQQRRIAEEIRSLDQQILTAADAATRMQVEARQKEMKAMSDMAIAEEQRLRSLEGEKSSALQAEQRRLDEINRQLDDLERSLSASQKP